MAKLFDGSFDDVLKDADKVYQSHKPKKGESWKTVDVQYLRNRLSEEIVEALKEGGDIDEYSELLDTINLALMLARRVKRD